MDKDFIDTIQRMVQEQGKEILVDGSGQAFLADYCGGNFPKEKATFKKILDAKCGEFINNADDILDRKKQLVKRLENDYDLSPNVTADYLDLLGLILRGDMTKCTEQPAPPPPQQKAAGSADALFKKGEDASKRRDEAEALECYLKAAEQGHAEAQYKVGIYYKNGFGVSKDKARAVYGEAFEWYRKAAEQGHESSQTVVGDYYKSGSARAGVPQARG